MRVPEDVNTPLYLPSRGESALMREPFCFEAVFLKTGPKQKGFFFH
jgi:hypothetical protein